MLDAGLPLSSRRLLSLDAGLPNASFRLNKEIIDEVMREAGLPDQPDEVSLPGDEVSLPGDEVSLPSDEVSLSGTSRGRPASRIGQNVVVAA